MHPCHPCHPQLYPRSTPGLGWPGGGLGGAWGAKKEAVFCKRDIYKSVDLESLRPSQPSRLRRDIPGGSYLPPTRAGLDETSVCAKDTNSLKLLLLLLLLYTSCRRGAVDREFVYIEKGNLVPPPPPPVVAGSPGSPGSPGSLDRPDRPDRPDRWVCRSR